MGEFMDKDLGGKGEEVPLPFHQDSLGKENDAGPGVLAPGI